MEHINQFLETIPAELQDAAAWVRTHPKLARQLCEVEPLDRVVFGRELRRAEETGDRLYHVLLLLQREMDGKT